MKILSITAPNFRSFAADDSPIEIPAGCFCLIGRWAGGVAVAADSNGTGKSSLPMAIEIGLFGARSLGDWLRTGEERMEITLVFEHAGATYRVRRSYTARGRGKSSLDFETLADAWEPLTQGNAKDTQALIERTIGLSRETFLASAYWSQDDGRAFCEALPSERKDTIAGALIEPVWGEAALAVTADRRAAEGDLAAVEGRIASLTERVQAAAGVAEQRETCAARLAGLDQRAAQADELIRSLDERHEQARAADEQWRARSSAVTAAEQLAAAHRRLAVEAQVALERLDGERTDASRLELLAAEHATKSAQLADLAQRDTARTDALRERDRLLSEHGRLIHAEQRHETLLRAANEKLRALEQAESPTCPTCEQHLPDQARETALSSLRAERDAANGALADARQQATVANRALIAHTVPDPVAGLDELRARLAEITGAPSDLAAARARIAELERTAGLLDDPAYRDEQERLDRQEHEARDQLAAITEPEPGTVYHLRSLLLDARAAQEAVRSEQQALGRDLARLDAQADAARTDVDQLAAARAEREQLAMRTEALRRIERGLQRDGVPAWYVEQFALPAIETEANRILGRLGGIVTHLELRTERENKDGTLAKNAPLDIICHTADGSREYATFSGGEKTRLSLALRIAFARFLAHGGAQVEFLWIDEPVGLDDTGTDALVEILHDLVTDGELSSTALASHDTNLRDRFDQALVVERDESGSRVVPA